MMAVAQDPIDADNDSMLAHSDRQQTLSPLI
jgi:hypothetical protein